MSKEVIKLAIEAFKDLEKHRGLHYPNIVKALEEALTQEQGEPVAWLHTKIEGVAVPHRPADLDKHPDRWEALYKKPPPCPTCEALARTVMLDQTSYDTTPPQRTWEGLTDKEIDEGLVRSNYAMQTAGAWRDGVEWATKQLKGKNT